MTRNYCIPVLVILIVNCLCITGVAGIPVIVGYGDAASALAATQSPGNNAELIDPDIFAVAMDISEAEIKTLQSDDTVRYVEKDATVSAGPPDFPVSELSLRSNPPVEKTPWNIRQIHADETRALNIDGKGVRVAVLDSGIDYTHPDLKGVFAGGYNYVANTADPLDDYAHGTHCAGILAAAGRGKGIFGTAPNVSLYAVKVLNARGDGNVSDIIKGIYWAQKNRMKIVSMSFGSPKDSAVLHEAIDNAAAHGVLFIAASGNRGSLRLVDYPANYSSVLSVGSVNRNNQHSLFSNGGKVDVSAPGEEILSTTSGGSYKTLKGTSMATPHVAGVAALIFSTHPDWSPEQVKYRIINTATNLGPAEKYGAGLVNAVNATRAG